MADLKLPPLPQPKMRRHQVSCAVFDPSPGHCDCSSLPKVYDADDLRRYGEECRTSGVPSDVLPVKWVGADGTHHEISIDYAARIAKWMFDIYDDVDQVDEVIVSVAAPVAPYAWMTGESQRRLAAGGNCKGAVPVHGKPSATATIPLYLHPPALGVAPSPAPSLTDGEIDRIWRDTPAQGDPTGKLFYRYFARAVEARVLGVKTSAPDCSFCCDQGDLPECPYCKKVLYRTPGVQGMQASSLNELLRIAHELRKLEDELNRGLQPRRDLEDFVRASGVQERRPLGGALAMRVLQSDLYRGLDDTERADCDELVRRNLDWCKADASGVPASDADLIAAAEKRAELYHDDPRQDIKTDVMNAFFAGAEWRRTRGVLASDGGQKP